LLQSVNVKKFGNNVIAEIVNKENKQDRNFYTLIIKKIITGDTYKIGQNLTISEDELKYYKTI